VKLAAIDLNQCSVPAFDQTLNDMSSKMEDAAMTELSQSSARGWTRKASTSIAQLAGGVLLTIEGWRERSRLRHELNNLRQRGELNRTLTDCGIAPSDVSRLMRAHPRTRQQLGEMMQRLGRDRAALPRAAAVLETLRAMEWQCGECADWRACRNWLASRDAPGSYRTFCPNAEALDQLRCSETTASGSSFGKPRGILAELRTATDVDGA
jgi:uncharacterized protein YjiS (DUF1127 family)